MEARRLFILGLCHHDKYEKPYLAESEAQGAAARGV